EIEKGDDGEAGQAGVLPDDHGEPEQAGGCRRGQSDGGCAKSSQGVCGAPRQREDRGVLCGDEKRSSRRGSAGARGVDSPVVERNHGWERFHVGEVVKVGIGSGRIEMEMAELEDVAGQKFPARESVGAGERNESGAKEQQGAEKNGAEEDGAVDPTSGG